MSDEPLVPVISSQNVLVEPIWEKPVDEIEGPLYQEYIRQNPSYTQLLLRSTVADMLVAAGKGLPAQYKLVLRAGHRPLEVQTKLLDMVKQDYLYKNPDTSDDQALVFARTYVSDPSIKLPPHCCGAAVDVDVIDRQTGELIDFGCPVNTDDEIAALGSDKINPEQRANRQMLVEAMTGAGFATFANEWWHFSYGDQEWATLYQKPSPIYGLIDA